MRYIYTAAWVVIGGVSLPQKLQEVELATSNDLRFILTRNPDALLTKVDEASAVGRLMLKGLFDKRGITDYQAALASEIEEIKAEREKKIATHPVLLFKAQGEIEASLKEPFREDESFIVTFDAIEKEKVRQLHQADIEAMKMAVAFENDVPSRFASLVEGVYLLNDARKPVYSISMSMNAELSVYTPLSDEAANRIRTRYIALSSEDDLGSVERLFAQLSERGTDRLKAFLSGWMALEILISKSFKSYERAFLSPFTNAEQPTLRERFLARVKDVMKDKYRLTDKFIAVTAVLFPTIEDTEADKNFVAFCKLKELRDSILHGEPFSENCLPVYEMAALLRKYVVARIAVS